MRLQGGMKREVGRRCRPSHVYGAGSVDRDSRWFVRVAAAKRRCINQPRSGRIELCDEDVLCRTTRLERLERHDEPSDVERSHDVDREPPVGLESGAAEIARVEHHRVDDERAPFIVVTDTEADATGSVERVPPRDYPTPFR